MCLLLWSANGSDTLVSVSYTHLDVYKRQVQDKDDGVAIADGDALLTVSKSADKTTAKVGDTITYTVNAANATGADVNIRDAVMTDTIPNGLTFRGNVTVDGYSAEYQYDNTGKTLTVSLGEIAPNQTKAICFDVTVNSDAYGMHIENTALVSGSNTPDKSGTDNGCLLYTSSRIRSIPSIGIQLITIIKIPTSKYKCPLYLALRYFE